MHTPDKPEKLTFDDTFQNGVSSFGPVSDFKDCTEDEEEDKRTPSEVKSTKTSSNRATMHCGRKEKRSERGVVRKGKENRKLNEPAKRKG